MTTARFSHVVLWLGAAGLVLGLPASRIALSGETPPNQATVTVRALETPPDHVAAGAFKIETSGPNQAFAYAVPPSAGVAGTYLIGVQLSRVSAALAAQLGLGEGKGLVVDAVVPGSPADKAGVKQHDVLVSLADVQVSEIKDVAAALDKAKGKEIQVHLIRQGKKQTVRLTPAPQPVPQPLVARVVAAPQGKEIVIFQPYAATPGGPVEYIAASAPPTEFPKDLKVVITKQGPAPAEIIVTRGDKTWKVTDRTLGELPEEVRKAVEQFLSRAPQRISLRAVTESKPPHAEQVRVIAAVPAAIPGPPGVVLSRALTVQPESADSVAKRLDEITKRLDAIEKALKEKR